jgi:16S rRNA (guanine527-N7)-methyltransferase
MKAAAWSPGARLSARQRIQLTAFQHQLLSFNQRFNLISRDTEAHVEERHLLHGLALTYRSFPPNSVVVDWGTGGGMPAIPLAICFPNVTVYAVDAVGKKAQAVRTMGRRLGLTNLHVWHGRAEEWHGRAHFSVSRATAPLRDLWYWHQRVGIWEMPSPGEGPWPLGLICLKGGDLREEVEMLKQGYPEVGVVMTPLQPLLRSSYFAEKVIVEVFLT